MTIHQRMQAVGEAANVPMFLQAWKKTAAYPVIPDVFAAYIVTTETPALCADDAEVIRSYGIQCHVFGVTDPSEAYEALRTAFKAASFLETRVVNLDDVLSGEYQYHKRIDVNFYEFTM